MKRSVQRVAVEFRQGPLTVVMAISPRGCESDCHPFGNPVIESPCFGHGAES